MALSNAVVRAIPMHANDNDPQSRHSDSSDMLMTALLGLVAVDDQASDGDPDQGKTLAQEIAGMNLEIIRNSSTDFVTRAICGWRWVKTATLKPIESTYRLVSFSDLEMEADLELAFTDVKPMTLRVKVTLIDPCNPFFGETVIDIVEG